MPDRPLTLVSTLVAGLIAGGGAALAQQGDRPGETQSPLPATLVVPPAPVLSPEEALRAFTLEPGFRIDVFAAEPLVVDPVAVAFDAAGRLWVVEMRGFMPNVDGTRELERVGRVVVLTDDDGDGRADTSTVFLDDLVLPRAVAPVFGGALVVAPPDLLYCRDVDGDGRADEQRLLYTGFGGLESPEHAGNGLLPGIDNWLYCSQHPLRFRFDGERLETQATPGHGQWGIARDDVGRLYYSPNSDPLRGDVFPPQYGARNRHQGRVAGINERFAEDMRVWPIRVTPGINRGYQPDMLDDGRLTRFTAACGPAIYRGTLFPDAYHHNAFVCEPAGNLVKRYVIDERDDGRPVATPARAGAEFLASTDERFRPVNAVTGPDGALYVVDFYRGIIQHRIFMTTFLRRQVVERGLDAPVGLGRIYRIVPAGAAPLVPPRLDRATDAELVEMLERGDGWSRDTAQRLLVERQPLGVASRLRALAANAPDPRTRLHALWTLAGIDALPPRVAVAALDDPSPFVRCAAIRLCETWLDDDDVLARLAPMIDDPSSLVQAQLAFSLGETASEDALSLMQRQLTEQIGDRRIRGAVVSGLAGRELDLVERLIADSRWSARDPEREATIDALLGPVLSGGEPEALTRLLEVAAARSSPGGWIEVRMLERVAAHQRVGTDEPRTIAIAAEPAGWSGLMSASSRERGERARAIDEHLQWPGRTRSSAAAPRELTREEQLMLIKGERGYRVTCGVCHQQGGTGQAGLAPPLVGTPLVLGPPERLIRMMLHGLTGPIEVEGATWNMPMPRSVEQSDSGIAAILTYVRRSWGNTADPVSSRMVQDVKRATRGRRAAWTYEELMGVADD